MEERVKEIMGAVAKLNGSATSPNQWYVTRSGAEDLARRVAELEAERDDIAERITLLLRDFSILHRCLEAADRMARGIDEFNDGFGMTLANAALAAYRATAQEVK